MDAPNGLFASRIVVANHAKENAAQRGLAGLTAGNGERDRTSFLVTSSVLMQAILGQANQDLWDCGTDFCIARIVNVIMSNLNRETGELRENCLATRDRKWRKASNKAERELFQLAAAWHKVGRSEKWNLACDPVAAAWDKPRSGKIFAERDHVWR